MERSSKIEARQAADETASPAAGIDAMTAQHEAFLPLLDRPEVARMAGAWPAVRRWRLEGAAEGGDPWDAVGYDLDEWAADAMVPGEIAERVARMLISCGLVRPDGTLVLQAEMVLRAKAAAYVQQIARAARQGQKPAEESEP